jgi:hypothetical protein
LKVGEDGRKEIESSGIVNGVPGSPLERPPVTGSSAKPVILIGTSGFISNFYQSQQLDPLPNFIQVWFNKFSLGFKATARYS